MRTIQNFITEKLTLSKGSVSKKEPMDKLQDILNDFTDKNTLLDTDDLTSDEYYDDFKSNYDDPSDAPDKYSDEYGEYLNRVSEINWDDCLDHLNKLFDNSNSQKTLKYGGLRMWARSGKGNPILPDDYNDLQDAIEDAIRGASDYKISLNDDKNVLEVINKDHDGTSYHYIVALAKGYEDDYEDWTYDRNSKVNYGDPLQVFLNPEVITTLEEK